MPCEVGQRALRILRRDLDVCAPTRRRAAALRRRFWLMSNADDVLALLDARGPLSRDLLDALRRAITRASASPRGSLHERIGAVRLRKEHSAWRTDEEPATRDQQGRRTVC
jgi:hypothetical protein